MKRALVAWKASPIELQAKELANAKAALEVE